MDETPTQPISFRRRCRRSPKEIQCIRDATLVFGPQRQRLSRSRALRDGVTKIWSPAPHFKKTVEPCQRRSNQAHIVKLQDHWDFTDCPGHSPGRDDDVRHPRLWGAPMDIVVWLRSLGLGKYEAIFRENDIDETVLPSLTHEDLKELGVASFGHRVKLLDAIAALRSDASLKTPFVTAARVRPSAVAPSDAPVAEALGERRHVTVMFCDLVGSTSISAGLDAEDWRDLVGAYLDAASAAVTEMGGHVAKKLGDGLMSLFGYPVAQENDAERAVRAALSIQRALAEVNRKNASCWQAGAQRPHRHRNRPSGCRCSG